MLGLLLRRSPSHYGQRNRGAAPVWMPPEQSASTDELSTDDTTMSTNVTLRIHGDRLDVSTSEEPAYSTRHACGERMGATMAALMLLDVPPTLAVDYIGTVYGDYDAETWADFRGVSPRVVETNADLVDRRVRSHARAFGLEDADAKIELR